MKINLLVILICICSSFTMIGQNVCINQGSNITFYEESFISETDQKPLSNDFALISGGTICSPGIITSDEQIVYSGSIDMLQLNQSEDKLASRQAMAYYHLDNARKNAEEILFINNFPFLSDEFISFGVKQTGSAELMVSFKEGNINIQLRDDDGYIAFSEDAFAIANSLFQALHYKMTGGNVPQTEGVGLGLASYFGHRYMTMNSYNTNTSIFTYGGKGSSLWAADLDIECVFKI